MDEESIFAAALEQAPGAARAAFLEGACRGDAKLKSRVAALLASHEQAGTFLNGPAATALTVDQAVVEKLGTQIGPYKLIQQVGEGGMGVVYMAEQSAPVRRKVALKIIKPGMDTRQVIARFEAERQALSLMDHPNIAKVLDAGTTETGRPYFVMELVKGQPITEYCDQQQMTPRQRLDMFLPVCHAIQHAHQKGIIHRDVKPSNVLVAEYDGRPVAKVIDFGVAKAVSQPMTERTMFTGLGQVVGTLEYMSPEQARVNQLDVDTRSDIYSLGVLLYELLTGSTPFDKQRLRSAAWDEMLRIIREEEPPRPSTRLSESKDSLPSISAQRHMEPGKLARLIRGELDWIVMKALEKDRNRRYETAYGLALDVQRYLHDEPVQACPPSAGYRFRKFAQRHRAAFAMMSVIGLAVLVSVIALSVSNIRIRQETREKEFALKQARANFVEAKRQEGIANSNAKRAAAQTRIAEANAREAKTQQRLVRRGFYAAQMNLAMQAWRTGEAPRVLELLEGQRPRPGEEDLRAFEWFYLWKLLNGGRGAPIAGHSNATMGVAFSPDGNTLASASWDGTVRLWDVRTGQELRVLLGHKRAPWEVTFSPDGKVLASSGKHVEELILWNVATGESIRTLPGSVMGLRFTPDGNSITGGRSNGNSVDYREWDVATGVEKVALAGTGVPLGKLSDQRSIATLVQLADRNEIQLWDLTTAKAHFARPVSNAWTAVVSADGARIAVATNTTIQIWDSATGDLLSEFLPRNNARSLAFSPDGTKLAAGMEDRRVLVWDVSTKQLVGQDVQNGVVWTLTFSPDGKWLASGTLAGAIKLWDLKPAHDATTISIAELRCGQFRPDGKQILIGTGDLTRIIDVASGTEIGSLPVSNVLAMSADAGTLAARTSKNDYIVWDVQASRKVADLVLPQTTDVNPRVTLSRDGKMLAGYSPWRGQDTVMLWDLTTRTSRELKVEPGNSTILSALCAAFSPDGKLLAAGFQFQFVTIWDVATGKVKLQFAQKPAMMCVTCVAFSPSSTTLAVGTDIGAVTLWDLAAGKQIIALRGHTSRVIALAFSPDGHTLATAGEDKTVRLWDVITGQERSTLMGHTEPVEGVVFSPDGFAIATGSKDGTIKIWRGATDAVALAPRGPLFPDPQPVPP